MKALQFNFAHPVEGTINFFNKTNPKEKHAQAFNTQSGECDISIDHLPKGKWNVIAPASHRTPYAFEMD